jgi:DNA-binding NtrC family response regulator
LLESELFGHVRGSFTSAWNNKKGLFEEAEGGTIFLDELSNMPISVQVKLLRFLQDGTIRPVGSNDQKKINARIIGASNRDLTEMVARGTFREDLYYRLNVIPLNLPPLRERREDIEMLTDYFLRRIAAEIGKAPQAIARRAIEKLLFHEWPGNVRELENTLKRGVALCQAEQLDIDDIMFIRNESTIDAPSFGMVPRGRLMDATQRQTILRALSDNNWNYTQTAQALGIGRTTLWRKMKKYELGSKGLDDAFGAEEMNESMVEELDEVMA